MQIHVLKIGFSWELPPHPYYWFWLDMSSWQNMGQSLWRRGSHTSSNISWWFITSFRWCQIYWLAFMWVENIIDFDSLRQWFCFQGMYFFFVKHKFNWKCQNINFSTDEYGMLELNLVYAYFLLKVLDLADTVIKLLTRSRHR